MNEITNINDFRVIKSNKLGFIAITDKNLKVNCVHHTSCYEVKERHFTQKVISNEGKNGSYYFTENPKEALDKFVKMKTCEKCFGE